MQTQHLTNIPFRFHSPSGKMVLILVALISFFLLTLAPGLIQACLSLLGIAAIFATVYFLIERARVGFTMTDTHFQQHLFKGGWVVKWNNISDIGICQYQQDGWCQPIPWVGIRLKEYSPYLESICPRICTQILLEQRALLYLGVKQAGKAQEFEDMVLDSHDYTTSKGETVTGLSAMLANRMRYQRAYWGYDIFIAEADLDRSLEEFVGLTRRFLAAAEPDV